MPEVPATWPVSSVAGVFGRVPVRSEPDARDMFRPIGTQGAQEWSTPGLLVVCVLEGWLLVTAPFLFVGGFTTFHLATAGAALGGTALAAAAFHSWQPDVRCCPLDTPRFIRQGLCGAAGSLVGLAACWAA